MSNKQIIFKFDGLEDVVKNFKHALWPQSGRIYQRNNISGKNIHNIKIEINAAIEDHNRAYTRLNENFRRYINQWETLGIDFYE